MFKKGDVVKVMEPWISVSKTAMNPPVGTVGIVNGQIAGSNVGVTFLLQPPEGCQWARVYMPSEIKKIGDAHEGG